MAASNNDKKSDKDDDNITCVAPYMYFWQETI